MVNATKPPVPPHPPLADATLPPAAPKAKPVKGAQQDGFLGSQALEATSPAEQGQEPKTGDGAK